MLSLDGSYGEGAGRFCAPPSPWPL